MVIQPEVSLVAGECSKSSISKPVGEILSTVLFPSKHAQNMNASAVPHETFMCKIDQLLWKNRRKWCLYRRPQTTASVSFVFSRLWQENRFFTSLHNFLHVLTQECVRPSCPGSMVFSQVNIKRASCQNPTSDFTKTNKRCISLYLNSWRATQHPEDYLLKNRSHVELHLSWYFEHVQRRKAGSKRRSIFSLTPWHCSSK